MIKIAIVDDNQFHINDVKNMLHECIKELCCEISEYLTQDSFIKEIDNKTFDIVFLDIVLNKDDGIELGKLINQKQPDANIIFISAYSEYFKDVYKVSHSYFLTKEFEKERFSDAIAKALKSLQKECITIHTKNDKYVIKLKDVMCFEGYLKHTRLYMTNGEMLNYNVNIKEIEPLLPEDSFVRTHQSFIVNMKYIKKYSRQTIYLNGDKVVSISRAYINSVREKITLFLGGAI